MNVIKRDGTVVKFNVAKIDLALIKAFKDVDPVDEITGELPYATRALITRIGNEIYHMDKDLTVEEIQDIIEKKLMASSRKDVAKAYILYREQRTKEREKKSILIKKVQARITGNNVENSNANVDEKSFSGKEKEVSSDIGKTIALEYGGLSARTAQLHKDMYVYQHDLEKAVYGVHNCLNVDFQELFENGFVTRNGDVRPPSSFSTACQLVAVGFQCQSQVQFGGVGSIHLDYDLAPFVILSFKKHLRDGFKYLLNFDEERIDFHMPTEFDVLLDDLECDEVDEYAGEFAKVYKYAYDMLNREGRQACEGLYHNLNTLESRQGSQVPFTSINLGRDTSPQGRLVTKWIFEASLNGIGKHHLTSIFPISIFQYKVGTNVNPEDPNYDMMELALESLSKRIYPNFANGNWSQAHEDDNDPDTYFSTINKTVA